MIDEKPRYKRVRSGLVAFSSVPIAASFSMSLSGFAANPQKLVDCAYRAVHVTAMTAKTIVRASMNPRTSSRTEPAPIAARYRTRPLPANLEIGADQPR